jgi:hypothetical protein
MCINITLRRRLWWFTRLVIMTLKVWYVQINADMCKSCISCRNLPSINTDMCKSCISCYNLLPNQRRLEHKEAFPAKVDFHSLLPTSLSKNGQPDKYDKHPTWDKHPKYDKYYNSYDKYYNSYAKYDNY